MAVAVVVFLEEVDVDEDRGKAGAKLLPVVPVVAKLLVNGPTILQARQWIGARQPQQGLSTFGRFTPRVGLDRTVLDSHK